MLHFLVVSDDYLIALEYRLSVDILALVFYLKKLYPGIENLSRIGSVIRLDRGTNMTKSYS